MKKIYMIAAMLLTLSLSDAVYAAPDKENNQSDSETQLIDDLFSFEDDDIDFTTAFLNVDLEEENIDELASGKNVDADELISYAKKFLGRPYVWGAKGPKAFDCSGFTSYVFRNFDINLSSASRVQCNQGEAVSNSDIRPGDLLFFKGRRSSGVGHVGIAIDVEGTGDVKFIHAASGGVKIDRISSKYYKNRYLFARRVIQ